MVHTCALLFALTVLPGDSADQPAPHSLDDIIKALERNTRSIFDSKSIDIEYAVTDSQTFVPSKYATHAAGFEFRLARKGDLWYAWLKGSTRPLRFKHDLTCVCRDGVYARLVGPTLSINTKPESYLYMWWDVFDNVGINTYKHLPPIPGNEPRHEFNQPFLPDVLQAHPGEYRVAPRLEEIDGVLCHLVERPGVDRIWLDAARGFALVRRELYCDGDVPPLTLKRVYSNRDFVEVRPGVWLPQTEFVDWYPDPTVEDREIWGKCACRTTTKVAKIEFDTLDDDFFTIQVPSGTYVNDFVRNVEYVAQGNGEPPFGPALRFVESKNLLPQRRIHWLMIANGTAILLLLAGLGLRLLKARRPAQSQPQ